MSIRLKDTISDLINRANKDGSGNIITDTYLKLSGGTVSNNTIEPLKIDSTHTEESQLRIKHKGTDRGLFGYITSRGMRMRNSPADADICISDEGNLNYIKKSVTYKIWNENNDGADSGLDADKLDGKHASSFSLTTHNHDGVYAPVHSHNYLPLSGGTLTGPLQIPLTSSGRWGMEFSNGNGAIGSEGENSYHYVLPHNGTSIIRSGNTDLLHRKASNDYIILDTSNYSTIISNTFFKKSGETELNLSAGNYAYNSDGKGVINLTNGDITGINGLYFADENDSISEGLIFKRSDSTTNIDSFSALNGVLYFNINKSLTDNTATDSGNIVYHSGNLTKVSQLTNDKGYLTNHQTIYNLTLSAGSFSAKTFDPNGSALTVNIPTHTSHLINDSGFVSSIGSYLPLTGGTLTGPLTIQKDQANLINLKRLSTSSGAFIDYYPSNQTTTYWRVGGEGTEKYEFGFLPNGNSNANHVSISHTGHLNVGSYVEHADTDRAELSIVSIGDSPCDLMLGSSKTKHWSISSRDTSMNKCLIIHSYEGTKHVFELDKEGHCRIGKNSSWSSMSSTITLDILGTTRTSSIYGTSGNLALIAATGCNVELQANGQLAGYKVCLDVGTKSFRPFSDSSGLIDLGSSNYGWKNIYAQKSILKSSTADILSLYRTTSGGGAWIDYYANNQTTSKWRVGAGLNDYFTWEAPDGSYVCRVYYNSTKGRRFEVGKEFSSFDINTDMNRAVMTLTSDGDAPTDFIMGANRYSWSITSRGSSQNYLLGFYSRDYGGYVSTMTIDGKVGIRTESPGQVLTVNGSLGCSTFYIGGEQITFTT